MSYRRFAARMSYVADRSLHAAIEPLEGRSYFAGVGQGLVAEYFIDQSFSKLAAARTDAQVNFNWPASPAAGIGSNNYSVRWTGQVLAEQNQTYTFYATSAGGVRVWVNGQKVIDNWTKHGSTENKGTIALKAGQYYPVQVDYREDGTGAVKLSWSSSSTPKAVIPKSQLYRAGTLPVTGGWLEGNVGSATGSVLGDAAGGYDVRYGPAVTPPAPSTVTLRAVADSYVRNGSYASQNFGSATDLVVKQNAAAGYARNGVLKFDLSSFASAADITAATLRLYARLGTSGSAVKVNAFSSTNTTWSEAGVNWNNQPAAGSSLGSFTVSSTTGAYKEINLTSFLKAEKAAGRNLVTVVLKASASADPNVLIASDESSSNRPELKVTKPAAAAKATVAQAPAAPPAAPPAQAAAVAQTVALRAIADASVRNGSYANQNDGDNADVVVKTHPLDGYARSGLFKFDLSSFASADAIGSADLRLWARLGAGSPATVRVNVFGSADAGWTESGVTWNNQPASDAGSLGSFVVSSSAGSWKTIDLTAYLKAEKAAGRNAVTVLLKSDAEHQPNVLIASDEAAANRPELLVATTSVSPPPPPGAPGDVVTLDDVADASVRNGSYANQNFGNDADLFVKASPTVGYARNGLLKYDLSSFASADEIESATLRYWAKVGSGGPATIQVNAYASSNTTWTESGVTWNNQPARGGLLGSFVVSSMSASWMTVDVTAHLKAEKAAGRNLVTIVLQSAAEHQPNVVIASGEAAAASRPQLVVQTTAAAPAGPTLAGLTLVDAATDADLRPFTGGTLDVAGGKAYSVRTDGDVASVTFHLDGVFLKTETVAPRAILGDDAGDYLPWVPTAGSHTLVVTPYAGPEATGAAGTPITVNFTATGGSSGGDGNAGGPIGGSADRFHYLYRAVRGNAFLSARVDPVTTAGAEAGLVVRPNLSATSTSIGLTVSAAGVSFEARTSADAVASATPVVPVSGPVFLKLVRDGNWYSGYLSTTGADGSWQLVGSAGGGLDTFAYFGLASGATSGSFDAGFDAVTLKPVNPLGGNLNFESDRVQDLPFVDLVKTTRGFFNTAGRLASNGFVDFATTDADGWPTEDFSFTAVDNSEWNLGVDAGTYKLSFVGPAGATLSAPAGITLNALGYDADTGVHTYDVVVGPGVLKLTLTFADTGGQVRSIRLLQPGYQLSSTQTFTDRYLTLLRTTGPSVLRFMDWSKTNDDPEATWADRPTPTDATQARAIAPGELQALKGISWEYCIQLANELGQGVWVNVGAHADDDYVRQLANLLRTTLRADLPIYVEHSNEVWNSAFEQSTHNKNQAVAEVFAGGSNLNYDNKPVDRTKPGAANPQADTWGDRRHARRTMEIAEIFRQAWTAAGEADPINKRVRVVLGGQVSNLSRFDNELAYLQKFYGDPKNHLYGLGVAPYIGLNKYETSTSATPAQVLEGMNLSVDNYVTGSSLTNTFTKAKAFGLKMVAYEGGPKTFGANNVTNKRLASLDPVMQGILNRYLTNWYAKGGELFQYYTIGGRSYQSEFGTWSITEDQDVLDSAKIKGYVQVRDATPLSTGLKGVFA